MLFFKNFVFWIFGNFFFISIKKLMWVFFFKIYSVDSLFEGFGILYKLLIFFLLKNFFRYERNMSIKIFFIFVSC